MAEATNPIATASNPRVGEDVGRGQRPHPFWYPLSKLEIAARGNRGAALTRDDVEALKSSLLGPLMAAAHAYGTSGASDTAAADPVIMPGAQVIASAPPPEAGAGGDLGEEETKGACLTAPGSCPSGDAPDGSSSQATAIPSRTLREAFSAGFWAWAGPANAAETLRWASDEEAAWQDWAALGTEAEGQDAEGSLVHEGPAPHGATP